MVNAEVSAAEIPHDNAVISRVDNNRNCKHCPSDENNEGWFGGWLSWVPTSESKFEKAERRLLSHLKSKWNGYFVDIPDGNKIWTLEVPNEKSNGVPLVLVHGFGSGVGLWILNLDSIAQHTSIYAFDMLGFARSSRPNFSSDPAEAERQFVTSVEEWRKGVGLDEFILLGHSFGGYVASSYAIKHPEHVRHLILADPWGMCEKPPPGEEPFKVPRWARFVAALMSPFNPLGVVRAAGPWGPNMVKRFRSDLQKKFSTAFEDESVLDYVYHCNVQTPSGETAFKSLTLSFGWAKFPMIHRIKDIDPSLPMTILFGSRSWVDSTTGYNIKHLRKDSFVDIQILRGSGHHVYADTPDQFNALVGDICQNWATEHALPIHSLSSDDESFVEIKRDISQLDAASSSI